MSASASKLALAAMAASSLGLAAGGARAEMLNLVCRVHETRGSAHRDLERRVDIDLAMKTVRYEDNVGKGWMFKREGALLGVNDERIALDNSDGKTAFVDRRTGAYFFHNSMNGITLKGPCQKAAAEGPAAPRKF